MTTVFVPDGKSRTSLAVVRSLGTHDVRVICGESTRYASSFASRHVDERVSYPDPETRPEAFVQTLERYLRDHDVDVFLPVDWISTPLISEQQARLAKHTILPIAPHEKFERLVRKDTVMKRAAALDIPHPKTVFPTSVDDACDLVRDLSFPVVIKPLSEAGSKGVQYVDDPAAFRASYETAHRFGPPPLVQEQIPREGRGMGAAILRWNGEIKARFEYQRLREFPLSGGPSTLRESIHDDRLFEAAATLLEDVDWQGVAMVEFKNDPRTDTPKLLEVNPRFWGSLHLPYRAGVEFPWLWAQCALGEDPDPVLTYPAGVRCRYLLPGDLMNLLSRRNLTAVREFFPLRDDGLYYDVLDWSDPLPAAVQLAVMMRQLLGYDTPQSATPPPTPSPLESPKT
jgi:predicted ATP-grasp superfamily ATP-dependent carboligase